MSAVADEDGILRNQTVLEQNRRARSTDGDQICMLSLNILMQGFKTVGRRTIRSRQATFACAVSAHAARIVRVRLSDRSAEH